MEDQLTRDIEGLGVYEEDDDSEYDESEEPVDLWFVENPKHKWSLLRQLFPSKAGGVPAWLDPVDLPTGRSCRCDICDAPLQFLLQVYAPLNLKETTFHRTLYVFICTSVMCLTRNQSKQQNGSVRKSVKVFRCQIPRVNAYYSPDSPKEDGTDKPTGAGAVLCDWCGCWKGDKICSGCNVAHYCSAIHRTTHWSSGHESECPRTNSLLPAKSTSVTTEKQRAASNVLWPEKEIIPKDKVKSESDNESFQNMDDVDSSYVPNDGLDDDDDDSTVAFMKESEGGNDKKCWAAFQECIAKDSGQVLRSGSLRPLWPMASGRPSEEDIPNCGHCGGDLIFEFQILPQLLYYLSVQNNKDSIDYETIAVYTCQASCDLGPSYKEEFAWVQVQPLLRRSRLQFRIRRPIRLPYEFRGNSVKKIKGRRERRQKRRRRRKEVAKKKRRAAAEE